MGLNCAPRSSGLVRHTLRCQRSSFLQSPPPGLSPPGGGPYEGPRVAERRPSCPLLGEPVLERQVLTERRVVYLQVLASWKMGNSFHKAYLRGRRGDSHLRAHLLEDGGLASRGPSPPLGGGRGFKRRVRGQNKEIRGGDCKVLYMPMSTVHSGKASDSEVCVVLVQSPGLLSPWLQGWRSAKSPELGGLRVGVCIS